MKITSFQDGSLFRIKCSQKEIQTIRNYANLVGEEFVITESILKGCFLIDNDEKRLIDEFISIYGDKNEIKTSKSSKKTKSG